MSEYFDKNVELQSLHWETKKTLCNGHITSKSLKCNHIMTNYNANHYQLIIGGWKHNNVADL